MSINFKGAAVRTIESLSPDDLKTVEKRMYPESWSESGFLKKGQSLKQVTEENYAVLENYKISYEQIADRLESLMKKFHQLQMSCCSWDKRIPVIEGRYIVQCELSKGVQVCPFAPSYKENCGSDFGLKNYGITRLDTHSVLNFPSLAVHMFRDHHFSQRGPYSVDLKVLIEFFELKPMISYAPKIEAANYWENLGERTLCDVKEVCITFAEENCSEKYDVAEGVVAYLIKKSKGMEKSRLLRNLDQNQVYLFLACKEDFNVPVSGKQIGQAYLAKSFIPGSHLMIMKEKERIILDDGDTTFRIQKAVFFENGNVVQLQPKPLKFC